MDCFALLDDCHASAAAPTSRLYTGWVREHCCDDPFELDALWSRVEHDMRAGLHAVVLADYEWGARLLQSGGEALSEHNAGRLRVLLFDRLVRMSTDQVDGWLAQVEPRRPGDDVSTPAPAGVLSFQPSVDRHVFADAIERIHAAIKAGETYQINYTYRNLFRAFGSPISLYRRLRARQPVAFGALIALPRSQHGPDYVLSCSPELFMRNRGGRVFVQPMKGTAARGQDEASDRRIAHDLAADAKNRAENVMIVDLLRNDLGRVAITGSVKVTSLFSVEAHPTVFQMTSSVEAALALHTRFPDLLRALFPCGSITGAPKHRSMHHIAALEATPRGLYTGTIGWIDAPAAERADAACGDFCLSVAIRTLVLNEVTPDAALGSVGVGAGVVSDSRAADEFAECALKSRFLTGLDPGIALFETMYATREHGIRHLNRHLVRMSASARELGFKWCGTTIDAALGQHVAALPPRTPSRMRLTLNHDGSFDVVVAALEPLGAAVVSLLVADQPIDDRNGLLRHKVTLRERYDASIRQAVARGAFDTLHYNLDGVLTEGGRSNVFLCIDDEWMTPRLAGDVLPGTMRAALLADETWQVRETMLTLEDLQRAQRIVVTNALRGVLDAFLLDDIV